MMLGEQIAEGFVQPYPVAVDAQIDPGRLGQRPDRLGDRLDDLAQPRGARQQRLPAVQHHPHQPESARTGVLGDPPPERRGRGRGHHLRLGAPALIGGLVHVTVVASQITARMHLDHELAKRG